MDFDPLNAQVKLRKESTPTNRTMTTANGAEFGNLRFNSDQAILSITSDLYVKRFEYKHGRFDIGTHNLRIDRLDIDLEPEARFDYNNNGSISGTSEIRVLSPADMFVTAGNASDGGISMYINGNGTYRFPFGIGTGATELLANGAKYTPATVTISNFSDDGYITLNPVDDVLGTTNNAGGNLLSYYWQVDHYNFSTLPTVKYQFLYNTDDLDGESETTWVAGKVLNETPFTRSGEDFEDTDGNGTLDTGEGTADVASVDESSKLIVFDGLSNGGYSLQKANYTSGEVNRFTGKVKVYYSRKAQSGYGNSNNTRWDAATSWAIGSHDEATATDYPRAGDVAIIGGSGTQRRPITIRGGTSVAAAQTVINRVNGDVRLFIENTATADLGVVKGNGTIQLYVDANVPNVTGDFGEFTNNYAEAADGTDGSRFLFYGSGESTITLPANPIVYPNVRIEGNGNRTFSFPTAVTVKGDMIVDNEATLRVESNLLVEGDLRFGLYKQGNLLFPNNLARTVTVKKRLRTKVSSGGGASAISVSNTVENGLEHRLIVEGDIDHQSGTIDLFSNNTGGNNVILELAGERSSSFSKSVTNDPEFYRVVMNKGANQDSTFTFEDEFTLRGSSNSANKSLQLLNGTLVLNDPDIDVALTTGGNNFIIPAAAALEVRNGQATASGDNTGILLAGTLRISGANAKVDMNDNTGNGNNYIEYSVGNPTLEISAGTLTVGSQIRRVLNDGTGALNYVQTGGSVTIGRQAIATPRPASENSRGMLEVINGGQFVHTGGELKIVRSNNSPSVATLFLEPGTFNVTNSEIILGDGNSPTNDLYRINSSIPLHRLTINNASNKNPRAELFVRPLTVNDQLTITDGATLDAGSGNLTLTLNGDFINNGVYVPNGNLTVLGGSSAQEITGSTATEFYDLDKTNGGTTTLQQPILVTRHLRMLDGTLADNGNTIKVRGNVTHDAVHTSAGGRRNCVRRHRPATANP